MSDQRPELRGRSSERARLDRVLADAREGHSAVLVIRGEAGIGKTALLGYVAEAAAGFRVVQLAGVESEMEWAYAGLHQACAPLLRPARLAPGTAGARPPGSRWASRPVIRRTGSSWHWPRSA